MANLKKCVNGHFYDSDLSDTCPYCTNESYHNPASQPNSTPNSQHISVQSLLKSSKMPWFIVGIFVIIVVILLFILISISSDARKAQQLLNESEHKIKLYDEMAISCGTHKSSSYYASTPIVFLDADEAPKRLDLYCSIKDNNGKTPTIQREIYYCGLTDSSYKDNFQRYGDNLTAEWGEWQAGNPHTYLMLSSKSKYGGLFILNFTNDINDTEFRVFVVVRPKKS